MKGMKMFRRVLFTRHVGPQTWDFSASTRTVFEAPDSTRNADKTQTT